MLPPGRLRLATRPSFTGSVALVKTIGIVLVAAFAPARQQGRLRRLPPLGDELDQPRAGQPIVLTLGGVVFDGDVLAFDVALFLQSLIECGHILGEKICVIEKSNGRYGRLLRTHREWPTGRCTAQQSDELTPSLTPTPPSLEIDIVLRRTNRLKEAHVIEGCPLWVISGQTVPA